MSYLYYVTSQKSTAVNISVVANFTSSTDNNLILAKGNHLEIYSITSTDGLTLLYDFPINGRIKALEAYRVPSNNQDYLFILTERKKFCILSFDMDTKKIITKTIGNVKDRIGRDAEMGQRGFIDPDGRVLCMILYDGLIKIIPFEGTGLGEAFNITLEENRILDVKFLYGCNRPTLCFLYEDNRRARHIKTMAISLRERELVAGPWQQPNVEFGASWIIPIPSPLNGVIVVGFSTLSYINGSGNIQTVEISPTQIFSYCKIDAQGTRYLLGDHKGTLMVLALHVNNMKVVSITTDIVGTTSIPESLNYLENGIVFVGSCLGDSQLIKLHAPGEYSETLEVLQTFTNIGPITDLCLVDNDKNGSQRQLVTCSGAYKDGSLRVIRCGISLHEQASLEISGIKGIWSLKKTDHTEFDTYMVQSFIGETRILAITNEELEETEIEGFASQLPTLYCANMIGNNLVQVTPTSIRLVSSTSLQLIQEIASDRNITIATGNDLQLIVAQSGGFIVYYELNSDKNQLISIANVKLDQEIACLSLRLTNPANDYMEIMDVEHTFSTVSPKEKSNLLVVGMWTDNTVRLLALPTLDETNRTVLGTETQARDIFLAPFQDKEYLLVGMGDGHLITYNLDITSGIPTLTNKRKGVLGKHPITFTRFYSAGNLCIFASCDRPTVIYAKNGKLLFSILDINNQEVAEMASFHSELFPDCLVLCSETNLLIGTVEDIQKINVQTLPLNEAPRRIAHCTSSGVYAVCLQRSSLTEKGEESISRVAFYEDGGLTEFASFELDPLEEGLSITTCLFEGCNKPYFVIGTAQVVNEELEPSRGRIIVIEITEEKKLNLLTEKETKSGVYTLAEINGKLAAGIGSKAQIFKWVIREDIMKQSNFVALPELQPECSHQGHIMVLTIKSFGDYLLLGDLVRSVILLKYKANESTLEEVSRDFNTNYIRAIEVMDGMEDHFLACDDHGNLFCLRRQSESTSEEEQAKLEVRCEFHMGDYVNVMRRGTLVVQPIENEVNINTITTTSSSSTAAVTTITTNNFNNDVFDPNYRSVTGLPNDKFSIIFATISGAVGSILALSESSYRFFGAVEKAIKNYSHPVGELPQDDWRSFQNDTRSSPCKNVIDGDLVESLLDFNREELAQVVRDINNELSNSPIANSQQNSGLTGVSSSSSGQLIANLMSNIFEFTPEEVLRRIEDIARLH